MNKILSILLALPFFCIGQQVISSRGGSHTNLNGSIHFTIGEVIVNTESDGNNTITQGFHQTNWTFAGVDNHDKNYEVIIFPNPMEETLNIRTKVFKNVSYILYDTQGKMIMQNELLKEKTSLQVSSLAPSKYSLILFNKKEKLKTFSLIKHK